MSHLSLSHVSFELRDWLTRSLLGLLSRNSVTTLSATLGTDDPKDYSVNLFSKEDEDTHDEFDIDTKYDIEPEQSNMNSPRRRKTR